MEGTISTGGLTQLISLPMFGATRSYNQQGYNLWNREDHGERQVESQNSQSVELRLETRKKKQILCGEDCELRTLRIVQNYEQG